MIVIDTRRTYICMHTYWIYLCTHDCYRYMTNTALEANMCGHEAILYVHRGLVPGRSKDNKTTIFSNPFYIMEWNLQIPHISFLVL